MEMKASIHLSVNGRNMTARQIEILEEVRRAGSKTAAANRLKISVPVVHRYIAGLERTLNIKLIASTPTGTKLTEEGLRILEVAEFLQLRCRLDRPFTISCSPVTEDLLMSALSSVKIKANLVISDDSGNLRALKEGLTDIIILDDPEFLFTAEEFEWAEIGNMDMVHVDKGPSYIRYKYGAQRIAYAYLDAIGGDYSVDAETYLLSDLLSSGKSFFVDEMLLIRKGIRIKSDTDKRLLRHTINAVFRRETPQIVKLLRAIQSKQIQ
ncbi:MAG: LysR family transcriptional regulator [Candidatus Methanomethylophilaceae archaeon]|jgi:molybdate transport repressor ModE-like protein|nr:LysR family transcriptional regulator [Candidatus Methanomethylophilaceae archaeon]